MNGDTYPPETFESIVTMLAEGMSLAEVCDKEGMPSKTTVYEQIRADTDFAKRYTMAVEARAQGRVDQLGDINKKLAEGTIDPSSARVISDNLKWLAAREDPKRFSERLSAELTGKDGKDLISEKPMDDLELARFLAWTIHKAEKRLEGQKLIEIEDQSDGRP